MKKEENNIPILPCNYLERTSPKSENVKTNQE